MSESPDEAMCVSSDLTRGLRLKVAQSRYLHRRYVHTLLDKRHWIGKVSKVPRDIDVECSQTARCSVSKIQSSCSTAERAFSCTVQRVWRWTADLRALHRDRRFARRATPLCSAGQGESMRESITTASRRPATSTLHCEKMSLILNVRRRTREHPNLWISHSRSLFQT